jgi:hypothetical protein
MRQKYARSGNQCVLTLEKKRNNIFFPPKLRFSSPSGVAKSVFKVKEEEKNPLWRGKLFGVSRCWAHSKKGE